MYNQIKFTKQISHLLLIPLVFGLALFLSACGSPKEKPVAVEEPISVTGQTVASSRQASQTISYPGLVTAASQATIAAKASGNLVELNIKIGDEVDRGQVLARIDDAVASVSPKSSFSANQVKQAEIAVSAAEASYKLAQENYNNILVSSVKDLRSAEIARDQAARGESNLAITTSDSLKSAELALETSRLATQQAISNLDNRQKLAEQSLKDTQTNAGLSASSAVATAGAIITSINNFSGFDENNNVTISYQSNLGALDSKTYDAAKQSYRAAKAAYNAYQDRTVGSVEAEIEAAITVVNAVKRAADDAKNLLDKSTSSVSLPQSSATGVSLSGLQAAVSGYQAQINGALSQVSGFKQALSSVVLNNETTLDGLRRAVQLTKQQEEMAKQNLNNLKSGNTSQKNQASFTSSLAQNQFDNARVKIETQVMAAKTQLETAKLQYNNALLSLDSLYDAYSVVSPISGTVTSILVAKDQSVSPGQPVVAVSQMDDIKVQFYIEAASLADIKPGVAATIITRDNQRLAAVISAVSPQADSLTRHFLAEAQLVTPTDLPLGTVVDVSLDIKTVAAGQGLIILPLETIIVGQNGSYILVADQGVARQRAVEIIEVKGELARVKVDLVDSDIIIMSGNRRLEDGQAVKLE